MTPRLSLVHGQARASSSFKPPPYRLVDRAQRPGELADLLTPVLDERACEHAEALSRDATLPLPLLIVIAAEAERALGEAATMVMLDRAELVAALDAAAAPTTASGFDPQPTRRLRGYAAALRSGGYHRRLQRLELAVPHRLLARWTIAAQDSGLTLDAWLSAMIAAATPGRERWEAQAAAEGRTLAEWVGLQALRRLRRSSSEAQATASG